ncbi:carbohydrate kinase family protein [Candidatus Bathyarchaeota archaeon]|nr:MAG: carbohydrate kinase family protein [Candidatus Bathyarchaeota archaeon]
MIAGVGPALMDYIHKIEDFPNKGEHSIVKATFVFPGGAAANVIHGLAKFGMRCKFFTTLGEDLDSKLWLNEFEKLGVSTKYKVTHKQIGKAVIYVDKSGERTFFIHPNSAGILTLSLKKKDLNNMNWIYLDPFPAKDSFKFHLKIAKTAKKITCNVILNPGMPYASLGLSKLSKLLNLTDILFISSDELKKLNCDAKDLLDFTKLVIVTLGKKGSIALTRDGSFFMPAFKVKKVVDTTGAGDAFAAGFLYAYIKGCKIKQCLKIGSFTAAYNIQRFGARNFPEKSKIDSKLKGKININNQIKKS